MVTFLRLEAGTGPLHAPAAASAGLLTDSPERYAFAGEGAVSARILARKLPPTPAAGLELHYAVFPEFDHTAAQIADGFRASAVAVDVLFDDGSRLLDTPVYDQHGLDAGAQAAFTSHLLAPDQWNLRRIALGGTERTAIALEVVVDCPLPSGAVAAELTGWLDGIALHPATPVDRSLPRSELVDTRRGTHSSPWLSRGNTAPFVAEPHGAVFVTPMTDLSNPHWNYTWNRHGESRRPRLAAIAISHAASIWIGDWGGLHLTPGPGSLDFDHENEVAQPHRYSVVTDGGIQASATATAHCVQVVFDIPGSGRTVTLGSFGEHRLWQGPTGQISGWVDGASVHQHVIPRVFVVIDASGAALDGDLLRVADDHAGPVTLRIGTSLLSIAVAEHALLTEQPSDRWHSVLDRVSVEGATDDQLVTLYSNLYRMFLYPSRLGEVLPDGGEAHAGVAVLESPPAFDEHTGLAVLPGAVSANNGFWDTYRTIWPAQLLLDPEGASALLDGFLQHYREGGWVPRWSAPGYLDAMVGTSVDIVLAHAATTGVPIDLETAYLAALRDATALPTHRAVGRKGQASSLLRGWVDDATPEGLSWTLESALNDYGTMLLAERLPDPRGARRAERRWLASRALAHEALFDSSTGFFRGRDAGGAHADGFDPRRWGGDYTETNAWGMAVSAPHAAARLAALHGGPAGLAALLDAFFAEQETAREEWRGEYPAVIHEMTEARDLRFGMWGLSNQPAHHIPFMYAFAGRPDAMQRIVREALARAFTGSDIGQGYPGDEDNGEMSAWWFLAALGLYPLVPGSGEWIVCSPLFPRMTVALPGGTLDVIAHDHDAGPYVAALRIDGEEWTSIAVPHERISSGAVLEFTMSAVPTAWGADSTPRSHDAPRLIDVGVGGGALGDNLAETVTVLEPGDYVELEAPEAVAMYTLLFDQPGVHAWRLEANGVVDDRVAEESLWPAQLRPFELPAPMTGTVRLTAVTRLALRQVELLAERL